MVRKLLTASIFFLLVLSASHGQVTRDDLPLVGAQVFIEPGQSEQLIDGWFRTLKEQGMPLCRIRMFERYMKDSVGQWDFSLFDKAFRAADKYGVQVYATLFPDTPFTDVGGFKFPCTERHRQQIAEYIRSVVSHFAPYKCLSTWVLVNEPGVKVPFNEEFTADKYKEWRRLNPAPSCNDEGYPVADYGQNRFVVWYQTWYLQWLADQVRLRDKSHDLHANPPSIFRTAPLFDFPALRRVLTTFGGSAHASWHFTMFDRADYDVAMSANAEIIRSGAGDRPWIMTEMQGGNNTYSGNDPMCPTAEEIAQWLWIVLSAEAKGAIFWALNPRASGTEAGEWGLVDFRDQPTDRLRAASAVARAVASPPGVMSDLRVCRSGIEVVYIRESMWVESALARGRNGGDNARNEGAAMASALGWFEALSRMGYQVDMSEIREVDFSGSDNSGRMIILSHQVAVPADMIAALDHFVATGGTLLIDGLTGYYDQQGHCSMMHGFAMQKFMGARPLEFKCVVGSPRLDVDGKMLPAHLWIGRLAMDGAKVSATWNGSPAACAYDYGAGRSIWLSSPVGLASRLSGDRVDLAAWLETALPQKIKDNSFHFERYEPGMLLRTARSGEHYLGVVINKGNRTRRVRIVTPQRMSSSLLFANKGGKVNSAVVTIHPEESMAIIFNRK